MTRIPLELEKRNKDFQILHEQANKIVYSCNRFESSFFKYWPDKNLCSFFCSMRSFTNYFIISIFSIRMLVRTSRGFAETVTYARTPAAGMEFNANSSHMGTADI